jgi:hypothetical protein
MPPTTTVAVDAAMPEHVTFNVSVGGLTTHCGKGQMPSTLHWRSDVGVGRTVSVPFTHTCRAVHPRSEVGVGGAEAYSVALHTVRSVHLRSEVGVGGPEAYSVALHTVRSVHLRSVVGVGGTEAYSVALHTVRSVH